MSTPRNLDTIIREGTWTPLRKRRPYKPRVSLHIYPSGWGLLFGVTWQGDRIYAVLSHQEVEEWNTNLKRSCARPAEQQARLEEGEL